MTIFLSVLISLAMSCSLAVFANADVSKTSVGEISKYQGTVLVRPASQQPAVKITTPSVALQVGSVVRTKDQSKAFVELIDGSKVVLKEISQLRIKDSNFFDVEDGMVLFEVARIKRKRPFRVGVKLAILGIRGTQFLVDAQADDYSIYLKEGSMFVESETQEFELYEQAQQEINAFKKEAAKEIEAFQSEIAKEMAKFDKEKQKELAKFVNKFEMHENSGISIQGNVARRIPVPDYIMQQFKLLDEF